MINRDTIVIGASAGGVEALPKIIGGLPTDLNAAVFVTMHVAAGDSGYLAERLNRVSATSRCSRCRRRAHRDQPNLLRRRRIGISCWKTAACGYRPVLGQSEKH